MAEESKETKEETKEEKLSFKTKDDLSNFLLDLQGQINDMEQTINKLSPVDEKEETENKEEKEEKEISDEEVSEIDQLLQSE